MSLSPMMAQYMTVKNEYKDCIVFYRLGDFYEMFFDDAITASKELGLTLTGRDCGQTERAPMCGVPHHAANTYLAELVAKGYKVALCEQLSEPNKKEIVKRGVVRVVTPGTKIDIDMLDEKENNYIAIISEHGGLYSVAWADISTGEANVMTGENKGDISELTEMLLKISPSEIISTTAISKLDIKETTRGFLPKIVAYHDWAFLVENAVKRIKTQFGVLTLEPYGIAENNSAISACGALFEYLEDTQKRELPHFSKISYIESNAYMKIDSNTRRNLELLYSNRDGKRFGTLYGLLNKTKTPMGARLLNKWIEEPLVNEKRINMRLDAVEELLEKYSHRDEIRTKLSTIRDIERLVSKVAYKNATPIDILSLKNSIANLPELKTVLAQFKGELIGRMDGSIEGFEELHSYLNSAIADTASSQTKDGGYIKEGFDANLDELNELMKSGKSFISRLEEKEREETGIKTLKVGYNRVFGYYIEILRSNQLDIPLHYVRKQTISNSERYITEELKELENKLLGATDNSLKLELELFKGVVAKLTEHLHSLILTAKAVASLDVIASFAEMSDKHSYKKPNIKKSNKEIAVVDGRHPVVEKLLKNERFIANDTYIDSTDQRTMILTGPNMAGKSTYMRQVALISIMAQMGCFVPCEKCSLPIFDRVFTRVGASDNLIMDQSTFMVEMIEVANILNNATKDSLLILDEVGRGTSTLDGLSIAFAVTKYINNVIKAKTLFATHYHELTELEGAIKGISNYRISVKEANGGIIFLRKIVRGGANRSFGIEVAQLAGIPKSVVIDAKKTLKELESQELVVAKKQLAFDDMSTAIEPEEINLHSEVIEKIKSIDMDEISPKEAYKILGDLVAEVE